MHTSINDKLIGFEHSQIVGKFLNLSSFISHLAFINPYHRGSWGHLPSIIRSEQGANNFYATNLLDHNLIIAGQRGMLQSKSCSICITDFPNALTITANDRKLVIMILLDTTKAFDYLSHHKLLPECR